MDDFEFGYYGQGPSKLPPVKLPAQPKWADPRKIRKFLQAMAAGQGMWWNVVFVVDEFENPFNTLERALIAADKCLTIMRMEPSTEYPGSYHYILQINGHEFARGVYADFETAKTELAKSATSALTNVCYFIQKKPKEEMICDVPTTAAYLLAASDWLPRNLFKLENPNAEEILNFDYFSPNALPALGMLVEILYALSYFAQSSKYFMFILRSNFILADYIEISRLAFRMGLGVMVPAMGINTCETLIIYKIITRFDVVIELLKTTGVDDMFKLILPNNFLMHWRIMTD